MYHGPIRRCGGAAAAAHYRSLRALIALAMSALDSDTGSTARSNHHDGPNRPQPQWASAHQPKAPRPDATEMPVRARAPPAQSPPAPPPQAGPQLGKVRKKLLLVAKSPPAGPAPVPRQPAGGKRLPPFGRSCRRSWPGQAGRPGDSTALAQQPEPDTGSQRLLPPGAQRRHRPLYEARDQGRAMRRLCTRALSFCEVLRWAPALYFRLTHSLRNLT